MGGVAQIMTVLAFTCGLGEMSRRLCDSRQAQSAGGTDNVLRQPSGFVPLLAGTGV